MYEMNAQHLEQQTLSSAVVGYQCKEGHISDTSVLIKAQSKKQILAWQKLAAHAGSCQLPELQSIRSVRLPPLAGVRNPRARRT